LQGSEDAFDGIEYILHMSKEDDHPIVISGVEFPIRRPVENFSFLQESSLPSKSWFEKTRREILKGVISGSDDLRFSRLLLVSMLSEAYDEKRFFDENKSLGVNYNDRLFLIAWLKYWSTFTGLLSAIDVRTIRALSERGLRRVVVGHFTRLIKEEHTIESLEKISERTNDLNNSGKLVGIFHGTFDPPTWIHLACANYYHQYCDHLIIGIDADDLARKRKGEGHPRYGFTKRHTVWSSFEHIVDSVIEFPDVIMQGGGYDNQKVSEYYQKLGVGIVFFNGKEPGHEDRITEIKNGGATPFDISPFDEKVFSSTQLVKFKESGTPWFVSVLDD
jgi:hypothetical protein